MSSSTTMPGQEPRQNGAASRSDRAGDGGAPIGVSVASSGTATPPRDGNDAKIVRSASPLVRALREIAPLRWWRSMPADAFRAAEYLAIRSALEQVATLIEGPEVEPALQGDVDAAIALVLSLMPIRRLGSITTDIAMTAVLRLALEGEPRCALVLAYIIDRAEPDPHLADLLCASWFEFHCVRAALRGGFAPAERAVLNALREVDVPRAGKECEA